MYLIHDIDGIQSNQTLGRHGGVPHPTTGREVRHLRSENVKFSQLTCVTPDMHGNTRHILLPHIQAHQ